MTNKRFNKFVKFIVSDNEDYGRIYQTCTLHSLGAGIQKLGRGHKSYSKNALFLLTSFPIIPILNQTN